jgi:hypothetical protein
MHIGCIKRTNNSYIGHYRGNISNKTNLPFNFKVSTKFIFFLINRLLMWRCDGAVRDMMVAWVHVHGACVHGGIIYNTLDIIFDCMSKFGVWLADVQGPTAPSLRAVPTRDSQRQETASGARRPPASPEAKLAMAANDR